MVRGPPASVGELFSVTVLSLSFVGLLCASMWLVSYNVSQVFQIRFDNQQVFPAVFTVAGFSLFAPLISSSRSLFGFAVSFYLFTVTAGYLWLSYFTPLQYDHETARLSAVATWVAFAVPALLIFKPLHIRDWLLPRQMDLLAGVLTLTAAAVAASGYFLGFHFVGLTEGEVLKQAISFPTWMNYAILMFVSAVLPFCYAWFVGRKRYAVAALILAVSLSYYPVALNKTTLLAPCWLVFMTVLLKIASWRIAVVLSLLLPLLVGLGDLAMHSAFPQHIPLYIFSVINFRMFTIPASAIDHYNHFFATHAVTNFCHITPIGKLFNCSLPEQLGTLMAREYATGNYNASLLATEGIASVGPYFAPVSAFLCGVVIGAGNIVSNRLDPSVVLLSVAVLLPVLMNVPLSVVMLSHGGFILLVLWLLTPATYPR